MSTPMNPILEGGIAFWSLPGPLQQGSSWEMPKIKVGPSDPEARRKPSDRFALGLSVASSESTAWLADGAFPGFGRQVAEGWIAIGILSIIVTIAWLIFRWRSLCSVDPIG